MADLPILFSAAMVRAILREIERPGTGKTQTRRVLDAWCEEPPAFVEDGVITAFDENYRPYRWPNTKAVGDRLWVREAWRADDFAPDTTIYRADAPGDVLTETKGIIRWKPGIHMHRARSRLTLTVTDVRVQRLKEISEADAMAEGMIEHPDRLFSQHHDHSEPSYGSAVTAFGVLWDSLNSDRGYGWDTNPWVSAYTFRPILGNIDQVRS